MRSDTYPQWIRIQQIFPCSQMTEQGKPSPASQSQDRSTSRPQRCLSTTRTHVYRTRLLPRGLKTKHLEVFSPSRSSSRTRAHLAKPPGTGSATKRESEKGCQLLRKDNCRQLEGRRADRARRPAARRGPVVVPGVPSPESLLEIESLWCNHQRPGVGARGCRGDDGALLDRCLPSPGRVLDRARPQGGLRHRLGVRVRAHCGPQRPHEVRFPPR